MARLTADVLYNVTGQSITHRVLQGRPTSATFSALFDDEGDDDTAIFTGTATVDSVNTTIDVASGQSQADPQKINLAATTSIVTSRKYLISEGSKQEWVQPVEIVSADYVRVRHPLKNDYTTAATFVSTSISAAVDSTFITSLNYVSDVEDPNPRYRMRWSIVVSGVTYIAYTFFDVVRVANEHHVDIDDINARAPGLVDSIPPEYRVEQGRPLTDAAFRSVTAKLTAAGINIDAIRDDQVMDELVIMRSLQMVAEGGWYRPAGFSPMEYVEVTRTNFDRFIEQHFMIAPKHRLATGITGGTDAGTVIAPPVSVWAK
jgi:hypothetical protein